MGIETDLNISPYFDDYNEDKNFHRVLFKPGVSVQVRELNQLQSILQKQVERFGNNIYKRGTIIDGCSFSFDDTVRYIKILDNDFYGVPINLGILNNSSFRVKNSNNVLSTIVDVSDGYESTVPDLKTLYIRYRNGGDTGSEYTYQPGQALTVYHKDKRLGDITINNGGLNFSNSDTLVITPQITVNVTSGTFTNGQYITDTTNGANLQIIDINTTIYSANNWVLLKLKPLDNVLANVNATANLWTIGVGNEITTNTAVATVIEKFGDLASAVISTSSSGKITSVVLTSRGSNYEYIPTVRARSIGNEAGLGTLDLEAKNFYTKIVVADGATAIGNSYYFGVSDGIIYQKGHFVKVQPQSIIVSKYNNIPNNVSVVFETKEDIINSNIDTSLLDNAIGTENQTAPGADRLKLTANLVVVSTANAEANAETYILTSFSDGFPFRQNQFTAFNAINDEMSERTNDQSGNFVLDPFAVTTRSPANTSFEGNTFSVVVDPGKAYISGYRVSTKANFVIDIPKSLDTVTANVNISLNYGNYIRVSDVAGMFQFNTGDIISLYDTAKDYIANSALAVSESITPTGTNIGQARIRSLVLENGIAGTSSAVYRLYLFQINVYPGYNFKDAKSVYYNGTIKGIADIILDYDPTSNTDIAIAKDSKNGKLVFNSAKTIKNANNVRYTYRTISSNVAMTGNGTSTISYTSIADEFFPYSTTLSTSDLQSLYVAPAGQGFKANVAITGTVTATTTSPNIVGSSTTFVSDLRIGDYVYVYSNTTSYDIKLVKNIVNNTLIIVDSNVSFANTTSNIKRYYPRYIPIPFGTRDGLSANVDANGNILTISLGSEIETPSNNHTIVGYNVERIGAAAGTKTASRDNYVKISTANNIANTVGPWSLGIKDIIRLRNVYKSNTSTVNTNSTDITKYFYIDHNHNEDYIDNGWLYLNPKYNLTLANTDWLLVEFDRANTFVSGYYTSVSYLTTNTTQIAINDSTSLANLNNSMHTMEVPEFFTNENKYFDLLKCFDFRPQSNNNANLTSNVSLATINPVELTPNNLFANVEYRFPLPDSKLTAQIEYYTGRNDIIRVNKNNTITISQGISNGALTTSNKNNDSIRIANIKIPPYPSIPENPSNQLQQIIDKKIASENFVFNRIIDRTISTDVNNKQPQAYNMKDINRLDRRVQNLEYTVSLSLAESNLKNKVIPSSISPEINRFKFGFFIDDFSNKNFTEDKDPEYSATVDIRK